jgi:hypothetical protein
MEPTNPNSAYAEDQKKKKRTKGLLILLGFELAGLLALCIYYFGFANKPSSSSEGTFGLKEAATSLLAIKDNHRTNGWPYGDKDLKATYLWKEGSSEPTKYAYAYQNKETFLASVITSRNDVVLSSRTYSHEADDSYLLTSVDSKGVVTTSASTLAKAKGDAYSRLYGLDGQGNLQSEVDLLLNLYAIASGASSSPSLHIDSQSLAGDNAGNCIISLSGVLSEGTSVITGVYLYYTNYELQAYARNTNTNGSIVAESATFTLS